MEELSSLPRIVGGQFADAVYTYSFEGFFLLAENAVGGDGFNAGAHKYTRLPANGARAARYVAMY